MTLIGTSVVFFIKANLYYCTGSLSKKHVDVLKSRNAWTSIATSLLHLTMISTNKHVLGLKISWDHFR
jgi:hypothetical protein